MSQQGPTNPTNNNAPKQIILDLGTVNTLRAALKKVDKNAPAPVKQPVKAIEGFNKPAEAITVVAKVVQPIVASQAIIHEAIAPVPPVRKESLAPKARRPLPKAPVKAPVAPINVDMPPPVPPRDDVVVEAPVAAPALPARDEEPVTVVTPVAKKPVANVDAGEELRKRIAQSALRRGVQVDAAPVVVAAPAPVVAAPAPVVSPEPVVAATPAPVVAEPAANIPVPPAPPAPPAAPKMPVVAANNAPIAKPGALLFSAADLANGGGRLKKTVTVDKSAPKLSANVNVAAAVAPAAVAPVGIANNGAVAVPAVAAKKPVNGDAAAELQRRIAESAARRSMKL